MESPFLRAAEDAARLAGGILQEWSTRFTAREKGPADLVTEADLAAQAAIHDLLRGRFPEHGFVGEEGLLTGGQAESRWIIDPLDGTTNYVHRFPYYAVSIALERAGVLELGVIYDPTRGEMFSAVRGEGVRLNGQPVQTSGCTRLSQAMVIASFPPGVQVDSPAIQRFLKVLPAAQTVHRSGSSALNLAYVAAGRLDGYWSTSLKSWDMAAGVLLVREAGGMVTQIDGGTFDVNVSNLLATSGGAWHAELAGLLASA